MHNELVITAALAIEEAKKAPSDPTLREKMERAVLAVANYRRRHVVK